MPSYSYRQSVPTLPPITDLPFPGNLVCACSDCELRAGANRPVPGEGATPAYVMFLGQNPGKEEDQWGRPFIGKAGHQLDSLLFQCSINRESVYITNVVRCLTRNNASPKPASVNACSKWLNIELELVQPKIIVAMGAFAIRRMLGDDAGTVEHLHGLPIEKDSRIILPCYHPAAGLHDTSTLRFLYDDFQVLRGLLQGKSVADYTIRDEYPNPDYKVANGWDVSDYMDDLQGAECAAVDVETVKRGTELWSVQVSTRPGTGWFLPALGQFNRIDYTGVKPTIVVHYYLNDINWLGIPDNNFLDTMTMAYLLGLPQGLKELASRLCGMRMVSYSEMVRPGQQALSLQYLTEASTREWPDPPELEETKWDNRHGRIVTRVKHPWPISRKIAKMFKDTVDGEDVDLWNRWQNIPSVERECVEKVLGVMPESSLADIPFEDAVQYATKDADATLRVKTKMEQLIHEAGLDFVLWMDTGILPMVRAMMSTGMAVDINHFRNLSVDYDARMRGKATELSSMIGHPFNPASSKQVADVVYNELDFKPTKTTATGLISTDDQELKKTGHPIAKGIIEYRRLSKMKGTYADALAEWAVPDSSGVPRVHTDLKTTRVATGRLASADPNLQNIPTRNKEAKLIKSGFVAPDGWLLGEGDLGQIEMCTQAHLANCLGLIDLFLRRADPHTTTAARLFGVPYEDAKQDKYRYPCKRAGFGIIYLIGPKGLSSQINEYIADLEMEGEPVDVEPWSEDDCAKFIDEYYGLYPEIRDYQQEMAAMARRYGYVQDMFGRRRYIPEVMCPVRSVQESGLRMAANMPVTASAQGIIKLAMRQLWQELPKTGWRDDVRFLMQIHDSLIVEMRDDTGFVQDYLTWMRNIMCGVVKLAVPVKVDFKVGTAWGDLKGYSLDDG